MASEELRDVSFFGFIKKTKPVAALVCIHSLLNVNYATDMGPGTVAQLQKTEYVFHEIESMTNPCTLITQ